MQKATRSASTTHPRPLSPPRQPDPICQAGPRNRNRAAPRTARTCPGLRKTVTGLSRSSRSDSHRCKVGRCPARTFRCSPGPVPSLQRERGQKLITTPPGTAAIGRFPATVALCAPSRSLCHLPVQEDQATREGSRTLVSRITFASAGIRCAHAPHSPNESPIDPESHRHPGVAEARLAPQHNGPRTVVPRPGLSERRLRGPCRGYATCAV